MTSGERADAIALQQNLNPFRQFFNRRVVVVFLQFDKVHSNVIINLYYGLYFAMKLSIYLR